eukprot:TRINITY_DN1319_c0_g2_i2.p1 TRINITY_DN1319_c0_g2~~TRINITY_DN1319_c0_g2_i2.p1  ORF type:complete len:565 (-),score=57.28 TRINITY_DN1319_c0_g2_i2:444-2138(-)
MEKRPRYNRTVEHKLEILDYAASHSGEEAARVFGCHPKSVRDWRKKESELRASTKRHETRSLSKGRKVSSSYADIEAKLYDWIVEKRSKGKSVTIPVLIAKIRRMKPALKEKSDNSLRCFLKRFMKRYFLVYRKPTHVGQSLPDDYLDRIAKFKAAFLELKNTHHVAENRIINMDEVAIYYEHTAARVISIKGSKTVTLTHSKAGQARITLVLAVAFDGKKFPPLLIFRGEFGKTLQKKLQNIPIVHQRKVYAICDEKAWNNSISMDYWIEHVWNTFDRNMQKNILIMDDYSVHKTTSVFNKLAACRTYPCLIPGGMTRLLQPLDVGINHIVKQELRNMFAFTSVEREEKPTLDQLRSNLIEWINATWNSPGSKVTPSKVKNCFAKCGVYEANEEEKENFREEVEKNEEEDKEDSASFDPADALNDIFQEEAVHTKNEDSSNESGSSEDEIKKSESEGSESEEVKSVAGGSENEEDKGIAGYPESKREKTKVAEKYKHDDVGAEEMNENQEESAIECMSDIPSSETPPQLIINGVLYVLKYAKDSSNQQECVKVNGYFMLSIAK